MQNTKANIHQVLQILHDGGRIDIFNSGNSFLTNIFGELMEFSSGILDYLVKENFVHTVHLHQPGGECYKISSIGVKYLKESHLEELCLIKKTVKAY